MTPCTHKLTDRGNAPCSHPINRLRATTAAPQVEFLTTDRVLNKFFRKFVMGEKSQ